MKIEIFEVGPFLENTYLLEQNAEAVLFDPGFSSPSEYQRFTDHLDNSGSSLIAILLTHAHVDHVLGLQQVLKDYDVPVYLNTDDLFLWENFGNQATMFGLKQVGFSFTPQPLPKDSTFNIGSFKFECLYTPGHSPDHTTFYQKEIGFCIAGDALFKESIGRTDLYKGSMDLLAESIRTKLYTLPEDTKIYPGHGPSTTIAHEKKFNPFVNG